jgi:aryl-alcohol dehydrogenase-like predicted oxidoreductase
VLRSLRETSPRQYIGVSRVLDPGSQPGGLFANAGRVGLGAWAFGGVGWGPQDDRDSIAAIRRAVELGVDWIDTAAIYGAGHSERLLGRALAQIAEADRPLVFTKCGLRLDEDAEQPRRDLTPASLIAECEQSLRRLGLERIDVYQLHWPVAEEDVVELAWDTLAELRRAGKIARAGVSNFDVELLERCSRRAPIDLIQLPMSLLDRRSAEQILPWAQAHGVPTIAYSPLESGLLSGRFSLARLQSLPPGDWRARRPQFQRPAIERSLELVELLRPIAEEAGCSLVELAVAWPLQWPAIAGVIVGARTPAQVDGWARAQQVTLARPVLERIEQALVTSGAGLGPVRAVAES